MSDVRKPARDRTEAEIAAAEMRATAERLHEMADAAEAGHNSVAIDVPGFHALAYYLESWSMSIDPTCHLGFNRALDDFVCSRCRAKWPDRCQTYDGASGWHGFLYCPNCGARVVMADD